MKPAVPVGACPPFPPCQGCGEPSVFRYTERDGRRSPTVYLCREHAAQFERETALTSTDTACTCGSGAHPRRCVRHPDEFERHCDELSSEGDQDREVLP